MSRSHHSQGAEITRLLEDARREKFWKFWGTYLPERQWGTVREDYSANGDVWASFSYDDARCRAYRWGEDGILGLCDRFGRLCIAPTFWNGNDPFLKERLFGLTGPQGNHGEDVKENYYYLDATPTHSYCRALYKYPQQAFPYEALIRTNAARSRMEPEFELEHTGVFDAGRYFDCFVEIAKADAEDILIRLKIHNRGPDAAPLHVLPTLWFRNSWAWGPQRDECTERPRIQSSAPLQLVCDHSAMGAYTMDFSPASDGTSPQFLFTENDTNCEQLYGSKNPQPYVKDAFHRAIIDGDSKAVNPERFGTKAAAHYKLQIPAGESVTISMRLTAGNSTAPAQTSFSDFDKIFDLRQAEADAFYAARLGQTKSASHRAILRQGYAGLLWSKQFYNLVQVEWAAGDPTEPAPPPGHASRNADWDNIFNRDVLSMPDKWEYPYYCSWDMAFHAISLSYIDPDFAKQQLILLLREWYMHPNGQIPAYEWNFSDVNPPVHAWAAWRVYRLPWLHAEADGAFLESVFQKLLLNFTWWVNRKDPDGNNLFSGGFLGLDNIGAFDRSKPLPTGGVLKQADGTAWMAFYCVQMLSIALELAQNDKVYQDMASKFFEHFSRIVHAINELGGTGLWDEQDSFYYDMLEVDGQHEPLRVRSIVGFMPLLAATIVPDSYLDSCPEFASRVDWFMRNRPLLAYHVTDAINPDGNEKHHLLSIPSRDHLERILRVMFDEDEFLSPFGIRSVSKFHDKSPYVYWAHGVPYSVDYEPGEGTTGMFGGNSNWRGPVWLPINYLLVESLRTYHRFYGENLKVEFPTRSGDFVTLGEAAKRLADRLIALFEADADFVRPCQSNQPLYSKDPNWRDLILFNEYFHAETGRGCGASHQTGWTALVTDLVNLRHHWKF